MGVHTSPYSGSWYPAAVSELERLLDRLFEQSAGRAPFLFPGGRGFVVPHAGPQYSGTVAAAAYRAIQQEKPDHVALLAFPHKGGLRGVAAPDAAGIATPLGEVEIDPSFGSFPVVSEERVCDHSFEIQLPFLQRVAPGARVTPLYVGPMPAAQREAAADALAAAWRPGTVFAASSDFTHYGRSFGYTPFPADDEISGRLRDLDFECIDAASTLDPARFLAALDETGATVCGSAPVALLLATLRRLDPGLHQVTLDYQTSGEVTGDYLHSVSYAALGYLPRSSFDLDGADREALLESAAGSINHLRLTGERRAFPASGSPALSARRGAFVSLHQGGELLGCLGNCLGRGSLAEDVAELALAAALEDPRFRPAASVKGEIDVEISVLTPFRRIFAAEECVVGRHGLMLKMGGRAGILLPQVAAERGWNAEQFLEALARKSMLGPRAWRDPKAKLFAFEAQVFSRPGAVT